MKLFSKKNKTLSLVKRYDIGEHEKSVEEKRGEAEFFLCFSSVLHVIAFSIIV